MKADKAFAYLQRHPDQWIPVTTDETIDALRELRAAGHRIVTRFNDDDSREAKYIPPEPVLDILAEAVRVFGTDVEKVVSADGEITEYPAPEPLTPGEAGRPFPMRRIETADGGWRVEITEWATCECGDKYLIKADHERGYHHQNWLRGETQIEVATPDPKPIYKFPEGEMPDHFELGTVVVCPVCKNKKRGEVKHRNGTITPAATFTSAPGRPGRPCSNCNGNGLIPNIGTIAHGGAPDGPEPKPFDVIPGGQLSHEGGESSEPVPQDPAGDHDQPAEPPA